MKTLIIDSNYLGMRAYYKLGGLSNDEIPTGVIFGFLSHILFLAKQFETDELVFCWDSKKSRRRKIYPLYKAHRKDKTPEELEELAVVYKQLNILRKKIIPAIGFRNSFMQTGFEADDIMAKIVQGKIGEWVVVTADEDLFQLLAPNVRVYNPAKKVMMTRKRLKRERGIEANDWAFMKSVAGCGSDGIPGAKGIGEKTFAQYLEGVLDEKSKKMITISDFLKTKQQRVFIKLTRLPLKGTIEPVMTSDVFDKKAFKEICEEYRMQSFLEGDRWQEWLSLFKGDFNED